MADTILLGEARGVRVSIRSTGMKLIFGHLKKRSLIYIVTKELYSICAKGLTGSHLLINIS